jgi:ankyrin repeat protein
MDYGTPAVWRCRAVAELLLANKSEVNAKTKFGWTPLHFAAFRGRNDAVEFLVANKADITAKNQEARSPLRTAIEEQQRLRQVSGGVRPKMRD